MKTFRALVWRDILIGMRASGGAALAAAFFALIIVLAPLGLGPDAGTLRAAGPGLFWIAALLATLLGLERVLQPDAEDGTLDLLRLSPLPLELVALAKIAAHWLTSGFIISLLAPLLAPLLSLDTPAIPILAASLLLGTPGLSAIGTAAAALGTSVQRGGMVLAILVLPLNIPFLIFGASAVSAAQANEDPTQALIFLTAASLIALVVGPIAAAAALRLNED
ncbi:MAG: heme exporter protein CcmB [Alphaproteobacteria bacterium]|nr:heme exporter protein CcmB [Alphaproteobacteria bacterium]MDZ4869520.1 heme exporter protein CcmB [Alphaproteobacteria bacterium]